MLGSKVDGCFVLTTQRSKLVAATQKVRAFHLHSYNEPIGGAVYFLKAQRKRDRLNERQNIDRQLDRQTDRQTDSQTDRKAGR